MPLKHSVETFLVLVLGILIVLAGVAAALLPAFATHPIPWMIALGVGLLYPLALHPLFTARRADYPLRTLHVVPALIIGVALLLQIFSSMWPVAALALAFFTWGWSMIVVVPALLLLLFFCVRVIRQRNLRSAFLALLLIPFAVTAYLHEYPQWQNGGVVAVQPSSSQNLAASQHPDEEQVRMQLRRMQRRQERLARLDGQDQVIAVHGAKDSLLIAAATQPGSGAKPPHLPSSGMATEAMMITMIGVYCGVLHQRMKRRIMFA